jgi:hypothetical protein
MNTKFLSSVENLVINLMHICMLNFLFHGYIFDVQIMHLQCS